MGEVCLEVLDVDGAMLCSISLIAKVDELCLLP
jgi:hypothetical protein